MLKYTRVVILGVIFGGLGACNSGSDSAPDRATEGYLNNPEIVALAFAQTESCEEAKSFVAENPEDDDFETCKFADDYIGQEECKTTISNVYLPGEESDVLQATVEVNLSCQEGEILDDNNRLYLIETSDGWKVSGANF